MNQNIEVKIKKLKVNYIATADLFPSCKGLGKTKEIALKKLASSISQFIGSMVEENLTDVFSSKCFTQIIFDQTKSTPEEIIGFNLFDKSKNDATLLFKFSEFSEASTDNADEELDKLEVPESIMDVFNIIDEPSNERDIFEEPILHQRPSKDSILFGFPLNFN